MATCVVPDCSVVLNVGTTNCQKITALGEDPRLNYIFENQHVPKREPFQKGVGLTTTIFQGTS